MKPQNQILNKKLITYRILNILYNNNLKNKLYQAKITRLIDSTLLSVVKAIKRLEQLKLIQLEINKKDVRMKHISITPKGIRLMDEVIKLERLLK